MMHPYTNSDASATTTNNNVNNEEIHDLEFSKHKGCCFFNILFFCNEPSNNIDRSSSWQRINSPETTVPSAVKDYPWWARGWHKIREWSELVAGPKWKTLIRRFNKRRNGNQAPGKFQYDPLSYSLNFDEGPGQNSHYEDDDIVGRGFSSRYSLPPSAKNSLDFDKEGLVFT